MDWMAHEELEAEWNAKFDYIAELKAEHYDPDWDTQPEEDDDKVDVEWDGDIPF